MVEKAMRLDPHYPAYYTLRGHKLRFFCHSERSEESHYRVEKQRDSSLRYAPFRMTFSDRVEYTCTA